MALFVILTFAAIAAGTVYARMADHTSSHVDKVNEMHYDYR